MLHLFLEGEKTMSPCFLLEVSLRKTKQFVQGANCSFSQNIHKTICYGVSLKKLGPKCHLCIPVTYFELGTSVSKSLILDYNLN